MENTIILNHDEYSALCSLVDYLHDDELRHYEETSGYNKHHIWHSVNTLSLKLKEFQMIDKEYCLNCGSLLGLDCGDAEPDYNEHYCSEGCYKMEIKEGK